MARQSCCCLLGTAPWGPLLAFAQERMHATSVPILEVSPLKVPGVQCLLLSDLLNLKLKFGPIYQFCAEFCWILLPHLCQLHIGSPENSVTGFRVMFRSCHSSRRPMGARCVQTAAYHLMPHLQQIDRISCSTLSTSAQTQSLSKHACCTAQCACMRGSVVSGMVAATMC